MHVLAVALALFALTEARLCEVADYQPTYTPCHPLTRLRNAVYYLNADCTVQGGASPPAPVIGLDCDIACAGGESLPFASSQCAPCLAGSSSIGGGDIYSVWTPVPGEFITECKTIQGASCNAWLPDNTTMPTSLSSGENGNLNSLTSNLLLNVRFIRPTGNLVRFTFIVDAEESYDSAIQYDGLEFLIDGEIMMPRESQVQDWLTKEFYVEPGFHTLQWVYSKDISNRYGNDKANIRRIELIGSDTAIEGPCPLCSPGTYANATGSSLCDPCPWNTYSNTNGLTICTDCDPTDFSLPGNVACRSRPTCEEGDASMTIGVCNVATGMQMFTPTWFPWYGAPERICLVDPATYTLPAASEEPCYCQPGETLNAVSGMCEGCPVGSVSPGGVVSATAPLSCEKCPMGSAAVPSLSMMRWVGTLPEGFTTGCTGDCPGWQLDGTSVRTGRVFGTFSSRFSLSFLTATDQAEVSWAVGVRSGRFDGKSGSCLLSVRVYRLDENGASHTVEIPPFSRTKWDMPCYERSIKTMTVPLETAGNYTVNFVFSQTSPEMDELSEAMLYQLNVTDFVGGSASACRPCAAGYFASADSTYCHVCPAGSWSFEGASACQPCSVGTFAPAQGASECLSCGMGTTSNAALTDCVTDCTYTDVANGLLYDLTPLGDTENMHPAGVFMNHRYYLNVCTREHTNTSCTDGDGNPIRTFACQQSFAWGYSIDIGDTIGFEDRSNYPLATTPAAPGSGIVVHYTHGDSCAHSDRETYVDMICDPDAGVGRPTAPAAHNTSVEVPQGSCNYTFEWRTAYACPVCTATMLSPRVGDCLDGVRQMSLQMTQPCWNRDGITDTSRISCDSTIITPPGVIVDGSAHVVHQGGVRYHVGAFPSGTRSISIYVTPTDATSVISVAGEAIAPATFVPIDVPAGNSTVVIKVTAEDTTSTDYYLSVEVLADPQTVVHKKGFPVPGVVAIVVALLLVVCVAGALYWKNRTLKYRYYNLLSKQDGMTSDFDEDLTDMVVATNTARSGFAALVEDDDDDSRI